MLMRRIEAKSSQPLQTVTRRKRALGFPFIWFVSDCTRPLRSATSGPSARQNVVGRQRVLDTGCAHTCEKGVGSRMEMRK